ncbi:MAG TPA: hypothetical protein VHC48_14340 [Puia sp.]|nr:hypothetical protein [Puia sp.]
MYTVGVPFHITGWVFAFYPGFILGYLIYASMHYAIHAWNHRSNG